MALVVESTGTGTRTATSTDLTITKPASVAVGDLLVTIIGWKNSTVRSLNTLSGWTRLSGYTGDDTLGINIFWKTADSGDVSASDYTWSMSGNCSYMSGATMRISGHAVGNEIAANEYDTASETDTSIPFTTASSPVSANSLLISALVTLDNVTVTAYASTPSATFTERADLPLAELCFGVATAPYTGTTQITSRDFTTSGSVSATQLGGFVIVNGTQNATGSNALLSADADSFSPTASSGTTGTNTLLSADADVFVPTAKGTSPTQWAPQSKPTTTWTPQSK